MQNGPSVAGFAEACTVRQTSRVGKTNTQTDRRHTWDTGWAEDRPPAPAAAGPQDAAAVPPPVQPHGVVQFAVDGPDLRLRVTAPGTHRPTAEAGAGRTRSKGWGFAGVARGGEKAGHSTDPQPARREPTLRLPLWPHVQPGRPAQQDRVRQRGENGQRMQVQRPATGQDGSNHPQRT